MKLLLPLCGPVALVLILVLPVLRGLGQPATQPDQLIKYPEDLSDETIRRLDRWVKRTDENQTPPLLRDIFGREPVAALGPRSAASHATKPEARPGPVLKGFVFTRGGQGGPKPLAAIDYEGQMFLVGRGDNVGPYRVERVEAGDVALLVDNDTGEKFQLTLN